MNYWTIWRNHLTLKARRSTSKVKRPLHHPVYCYYYYYYCYYSCYNLYAGYLQLYTWNKPCF